MECWSQIYNNLFLDICIYISCWQFVFSCYCLQENFPRRSLRGLAKTPLKQVLPYGAGQTQTTPIKAVEAPAEPLTPTANLKMLISAASPDMRDREHKKKELFRSPVNNLEEDDDEEDEYEEDVQVSEIEWVCQSCIIFICPSQRFWSEWSISLF